MFTEILPNVLPAILVEFTVRLGYAIFAVASLSFLGLRRSSRRPRTGARTSPRTTSRSGAGYWWMTLFPALAIASLVIAINLVTDAIEQVLAVMTATSEAAAAGPAAAAAAGGRRSSTSTSPTGSAARTGGRCRTCRSRSAAGVLRPGRRVRLRQVHGRAGADQVPAAQRPGQRGLDQHRGRDPLGHGPAELRELRATHGVDGVPGAGPGAEPVDPGRPPGRRGLRGRRARTGRRRWSGPRRCCARCRSPTPARSWSRYPHQLSGGMAQRAVDRDGARRRARRC